MYYVKEYYENEFYYYTEDLTSHEDTSGWDTSDDGTKYEDITYYKDYLYDESEQYAGMEEKVCDSEGNVLVSYTTSADFDFGQEVPAFGCVDR